MDPVDAPPPPEGYHFSTRPDPAGAFAKTVSLLVVFSVWHAVRSSAAVPVDPRLVGVLAGTSVGVAAVHTGIQSAVFRVRGYEPAVSLPHLSVVSPDRFVGRMDATLAYASPLVVLALLSAAFLALPGSVLRVALGFGIGLECGVLVLDLRAAAVLLRAPGGSVLYSRLEDAGPAVYIYSPGTTR